MTVLESSVNVNAIIWMLTVIFAENLQYCLSNLVFLAEV